MNTTSTNANQAQEKVRVACAYLFSPKHARDNGFVRNLKFSMVKNAFREKAKRYHPDMNGNSGDEMLEKRRERFIKIKKAYEYLSFQFEKAQPYVKVTPSPVKRKKAKVIAVGGAKGGIGKSIFASNLSVLLSQKGYNTVAADFDFGGSNLHLYLGETSIKNTVNDYLANEVLDIAEIETQTKYGPRLIGGNSSQLGAANISYARKMKLLKALSGIDADYIVVDLGGDTSYNVLDFFLASDYGIVMTTCDPASYLDAYSFIKVSIYRKLNRLLGPESWYKGKHDSYLEKIIYDATMSENGLMVENIDELLQRVKEKHPKSLDLVKRTLIDFNPLIIVNKAINESVALKPVTRIQDVSRKKLSINVEYAGSMAHEVDVEASARSLVPVVASNPNGRLATRIEGIATQLFGI